MIIHWVPGVVAAIHCISTQRADYTVMKTLTWAGKADFCHKVFALIFYIDLRKLL